MIIKYDFFLEKISFKYRKGEGVILDPFYFKDKTARNALIVGYDLMSPSKVVVGYYVDTLTDKNVYVTQRMIIGKLSDDELEKFKIQINSNKFNL